jgi:hypothetical protein
MMLRPSIAILAVSAFPSLAAQGEGAIDVPLALWTSPEWPEGVLLGIGHGASMGDYDGDGWTDVFVLQSGNLWRNLQGQGWELAANLLGTMPAATKRYGATFGDFDNDGIADMAVQPRNIAPGDTCFRLLHGLGGGAFLDVASDPLIVDTQVCGAHSETACWADVDGDRNLDLLLPIYPEEICGALFSTGNAFFYNLGPTGPGNAYAFTEMAVPAGLGNPPGTCRPEGAQMVDIDFDGDVDLCTGGGLYRNLSAPGTPFFDLITATAGIQHAETRDEGLAFLDVDMDGDYDLVITYIDNEIGVRIYEARGDGSYTLLPTSVVEAHSINNRLGLTYADWDNDGDIDITTRQAFRRNMFVETGVTSFAVATHAIPLDHIGSNLSPWGDWDLDGDVDTALTSYNGQGRIYDNTLYDDATPLSERRYVRVRVVNDSALVPMGLETEYGASVEVKVQGDTPGIRRRQHVSSASGYLNQNEYGLHFGLPPDPVPANPAVDLLLDVSVDFPGTPDAGYTRVDRFVNPVLGGIPLAQLEDRQIHVFRGGKVILDGTTYDPATPQLSALITTNEGLQSPTPLEAVALLEVSAPDQFVGVEIDTTGATDPVRVTEIVLDGMLAPAVDCGTAAGNLLFWDVTTSGSPVLLTAFDAITRTTNDRSYLPVDVVVPVGRVVRVVAAVTSHRTSALVAVPGPAQVTGGLLYADVDPCSGVWVEGAAVDALNVPLALRYQPVQTAAVANLGHGLAGTAGVPLLSGVGPALGGQPFSLTLTDAAPSAPLGVVVGKTVDPVPFFGGTLVPSLQILATNLFTDANGDVTVSTTWPTVSYPGFTLYFQAAVWDPGAPASIALSNAIGVTTQP